MFIYTLNKISKLGDLDSTYGQRWWGEITEDLKPVSFNTMSGEFKIGDKITCEETVNKRSTKGVDYLQLKKVRLLDSEQKTPSEAPKTPQNGNLSLQDVINHLDRIETNLQEVMSKLDNLNSEPELPAGWNE